MGSEGMQIACDFVINHKKPLNLVPALTYLWKMFTRCLILGILSYNGTNEPKSCSIPLNTFSALKSTAGCWKCLAIHTLTSDSKAQSALFHLQIPSTWLRCISQANDQGFERHPLTVAVMYGAIAGLPKSRDHIAHTLIRIAVFKEDVINPQGSDVAVDHSEFDTSEVYVNIHS